MDLISAKPLGTDYLLFIDGLNQGWFFMGKVNSQPRLVASLGLHPTGAHHGESDQQTSGREGYPHPWTTQLASGRACYVTPSSLTLTMTFTQCFQPTDRSIALWWTLARPSTRCHMGGSSQSSTDTEYEAKTSTGSRTLLGTTLNEWS